MDLLAEASTTRLALSAWMSTACSHETLCGVRGRATAGGTLMETFFNVLLVDGEASAHVVDLPEFPTRDELRLVVEPHLCGMAMHHVQVLSPPRGIDPETSRDSIDLFCGETAVLRCLPVNREATRLYRAAHLLFHPADDPETLPHIAGPAVLFLRRVIPVAGDEAGSLPAPGWARGRGRRGGDGHGSSPAP